MDRHRSPKSVQNCRLRTRWASSIPDNITAAVRGDLNASIEAHRCLIARWSCSTRLFRYRQSRTTTDRQRSSSWPSKRTARWLAVYPSRLIVFGHPTAGFATAFRKKACAASRCAPRRVVNRPICLAGPQRDRDRAPRREPTRTFHPMRQEDPTGRANRAHRLSYSGMYRSTQRMIDVCDTATPRSAIMAARSR